MMILKQLRLLIERQRMVALSAAFLVVGGSGAVGGACAHDWDTYDPRVSGGTGMATGGSGGLGGQGGMGHGGGGQGGQGGSLPSGQLLCTRGFGDSARQEVRAVAVDNMGNVVLVGYFLGSFNFGGGQLTSVGEGDIFVAKFDAQCNHIFSLGFGGPMGDSAWGVAVNAAGEIAFVGAFHDTVSFGSTQVTSAGGTDAYVAKLSSTGNFLWAKTFGDVSNQYGNAVAFDPSGNVVFVGDFDGVVDFGGGDVTSLGADVFAVKLDPQGNHLFSTRIGGFNWDHVRGLVVDAMGNTILAGGFYDSMDVGGATFTSAGMHDAYAVKLGPTGTVLWGKQFGSPGATDEDYIRNIAVDSMGNVILSGRFEGSIDWGQGPVQSAGQRDIFLIKLNSAGAVLWGKTLGGPLDDNVINIATDALGNFFLTGTFEGDVDFGGGLLSSAGAEDVFLAKYNASGEHLWSKGFGDINDQNGRAVAVGSSGPLALVGDGYDSIDFGNGALVSAGARDIFIALFSP